MIELTFIISALFAVIFYFFVRYRQNYWKRQKIPYVKPKFFFGNTKEVDTEIHHTVFWRNIYQELKPQGPVGGFYNYLDPVAIITDLDLLKQIMIKDFTYFTDRGNYHNITQDPVSGHLINLEGEDWKFMRSKLSPGFSTGKLKLMLPIIDRQIEILINVMENKMNSTGQFEVRDIMARYLSDILGITAFGIECNSLTDEDSEFHKMAIHSLATTRYKKKTLLESNRSLCQKLGIINTEKTSLKFYSDVVDGILHYRRTSNVERNDILGLMLNSKDTSRVITRDEILAQAAVFLVGGHETQLAALSYTLYELAIHKDYQQRARDEVEEVFGKNNGKLTYEALGEMKYVEQCINEGLRKYFISFSAKRETRKDYKIPNTDMVLKKGTLFQVPIYAIHNDPDYYPNPDVYNPDRFSPEETAKRHSFSFIPFGEGPRTCIGKRFAQTVTKSTIAKILYNYELSVDRTKTSIPLKINPEILFVTPMDGIYVNLKKLER